MEKVKMLGALVGDIIGSVYEFCNVKSTDFELFSNNSRFTDDSVMTLAVAKWLTEDKNHSYVNLIRCMQELGRRYPRAGYGGHFDRWIWEEDPRPYNSWGNGAGMRVSPVGLYAKSMDEAMELAYITASVSHNHPEGVKGAQAIAACVFLAKDGQSKTEIKDYIEEKFGYKLNRTIEEIRSDYYFDVSCQGSVPEAITAFLEGNSFEEVIRLAISLGGDSDTIACMAGAIAACKYQIPEDIAERCDKILTEDLRGIKNRFVELLEESSPYTLKLTKDNYKDYLGLEVVAFSSAAGGAMGDTGGIEIVTSEGKVYYANPCYEDITLDQVFEVCPPLAECRFGVFGGGVIPDGWETIYLGFGNSLVLKDSIYKELQQRVPQLKEMRAGELYNQWLDIVKQILGEQH